MIEIENLISFFWCFTWGYWCFDRIFNHFGILSNWARRSLDNIVCYNTGPVWSVICTIEFVVISKLPLACAVSLAVVTLKNVISSSSLCIIIWHSPSLRADPFRTHNLLYWLLLFIDDFDILFSWVCSSLREHLVLYLILIGFILVALIFTNNLTHHECSTKRNKLLHLVTLL